MDKTMKLIFVSLGIAVILASCGAGEKDGQNKKPPPTAVSVKVAERQSAVYYDEYPATVTALSQVDLRAQVTGYVTGIFFKDGQRVHRGQKLYNIDKQQYQANYDQAIANLNVQKANLFKAQQDADRYADLYKQDAVAKQLYDHALADLQSAKMQVVAAQSNVRNVQATVKYSFISAPFDGTIGISLVKMGALVTANQTLLNTISSDNPMAVDVEVDQKEIPRFIQLQQTSLTTADSTLVVKLSDNTFYPQTGRVSFIDRAVDPQTGTIKTRLVFPNPKNILKAGMNVNVRIKNSSTDGLSLMIPYKAVTEQMGEYFVFVVNDSSQAIQHKLSLGARINDMVVVKEGLSEGDKIVTEGFQKLKDSARVQVTSDVKR
jgi:RND family efflux transporter MFP subunit